MAVDLAFVQALSYAARRHRDQRRKGRLAEPYINHCVEVARLLIEVGGVDDTALLCAAVLHDVIEDTATTEAELRAAFGDEITGLVLEVTDDNTLPKLERKRRQIATAAAASPRARCLKLADKIHNVSALLVDRPPDWTTARVAAYAEWAAAVAAELVGSNAPLERLLAERIEALRAACA